MSSPATSPKHALVEELRDYYEQIENIKEDAQELTTPLSDDQFNWRPSPKRWSIAECLVHLNLADGLDLASLSTEIDRCRSANITGQSPFRYSFFSRAFIRYAEPPPKLRVSAPKAYRPPVGHRKDQVLPEFLTIHDRWLQLLVNSNGLDLARIKVKIPIGFKFSLGQRFALVTAHDRRHLWQGWEVRKHPKFPI